MQAVFPLSEARWRLLPRSVSNNCFPYWLRAFVRTREIGLVVAALFIGAMSGLLVAAMGLITQDMHVIFFGFPIDERLSAQQALYRGGPF